LASWSLALGLVAASPLSGCIERGDANGDTIAPPANGDLIDSDGDGFAINSPDEASRDCADGDPLINPDADEICDRADNDCDDKVDEDAVDSLEWFIDVDGDGFGYRTAEPLLACARPDGYTNNRIDCNDEDDDVFPGAPEKCNDKDDNCNIDIDEGFRKDREWFLDLDRDGYGAGEPVATGCALDPSWVSTNDDCNDVRDAVNPGAPEICDGADNDCDFLVDDSDDVVTGAPVWFRDFDNDGYGNVLRMEQKCQQPFGFVPNPDDCNDLDVSQSPLTRWWVDADGDGTGSAALEWPYRQCWQPIGFANNTDDCDDANPLANTLADWHPDADGDGFGGPQVLGTGCVSVPGWVRDTSDCDDRNAARSPDATEICDELDNDCDGTIDDADDDVVGQATWYRDGDGDGFGAAWDPGTGCEAPDGFVAAPGDCDDAEALLTPETRWWRDADRDGYGDPNVAWPDAQCEPLPGYIPNDSDCDDANFVYNDFTPWFPDNDGDGLGFGIDFTDFGCLAGSAGVSNVSGDCDDDDPLNVEGGCFGPQLALVRLLIQVDNDGFGQSVELACSGQAPIVTTLRGADFRQLLTVDAQVPDAASCRVTVRGPRYDFSGDGAANVDIELCGAPAGSLVGVIAGDVTSPSFVVDACSGCADPAAENYDPTVVIDTGFCIYAP
jgi:hypothetical protein